MDCNKSLQNLIHNTTPSQYVQCGFNNTEQKEKQNDAFINKCRVCLDIGNIPIFDSEASLDKSADLKVFGDIEVSCEDNFPKYICEDCVKLLEAAILFRKTAKQSDEYLRSNENYYDNVEYNYIKLSTPKLEAATDYEDGNGAAVLANTINIKEEIIAVNYTNNDDMYFDENSLKDSITITTGDNINQGLLLVEDSSSDLLLKQNKYNCNTCNVNLESSKEYSQHKKSSKHKKARHVNKIECKVCSKKISRAFFNRHIEMHSSDSKDEKLQCPICNKSYSKTYFNYHLTHTHNQDNKKAQSERIECSICNKTYEKQYYKFHLAIHDNALSKYVCDTCGKSFIQLSAFKRHRLIHGNELAYKCTLCPYRGRHPGLVKTHMQTHTRDYQHRCMECPARFLTKSNLNKHLQRHKGPVDFKCDTCKRGFYSKLELERHFEADHLGVKNHVCNVCGKAFGYRNAMMSHQLKVHKREKLTNGKGRLPLYLEAERKI